VTIAAFLQLLQILGGIGTVAKDLISIKDAISGKEGHEMLPDEHVATVKRVLAPAFDSTAEGFIERLRQ
jgi:hypothetical protein